MTQAPLPRFRDLFLAIFQQEISDRALAIPWAAPDDQYYWFARSTWALAVISQWRQKLSLKKNITIWVPSFFCNEALIPLREKGAKLVFYPMNNTAKPDYSQFGELLESAKPDLFVLVHYFGTPTPTENAVALCRQHGAWLVEDAAHVLQPISGVGEMGDIVFYSPHKHLAIPDGALLIVKRKGPANLGTLLNAMIQLQKLYLVSNKSAIIYNKSHYIWLAKRVLQRLGLRSMHQASPFGCSENLQPMKLGPAAMSILAKRLLTRAIRDIPQIATYREECANHWRRVMDWAILKNDIRLIPNPATPYLACFGAADSRSAELLFQQFQSAGLPVTTWPDLPPEISPSLNSHTNTWALRHTRVYLPVHQSVDQKQIIVCGKKLHTLGTKQWKLKRIVRKDEWDIYWKDCPRKSLPQAWEYGTAKEMAEGWHVQRYVIFNEYDDPTAIVQILVKRIPMLGGVARINRGPLLLVDNSDYEVKAKLGAIRVLMREARKQRWWVVQIAPELTPGLEAKSGLHALGFKKRPNFPADSSLLYLGPTENELLKQLKGKWRNCLRKGEKLGVCAFLAKSDANFHILLDYYKSQQRQKGFKGTSEKMLRAMTLNQSDLWRFNIFIAREEEDAPGDSPLGMLVTIQYHDTTDYLLGATNEKGRRMQANSVLLWHSLLHAKNNGCKWFDVGGLSEDTPKGIANFKKGLNAEQYHLIGEWRNINTILYKT
jgi:hypothetical protein